jgi:hypothetical protein
MIRRIRLIAALLTAAVMTTLAISARAELQWTSPAAIFSRYTRHHRFLR